MMNPDVDSDTKTLNHRKILPNTQKTTTQPTENRKNTKTKI